MAECIIMPKQGLQMTEGTILEWLVAEGGEVVAGKPLFEMETDKLAITIEAEVSGTLLKIVAQEGDVVPITETIAIVGKAGEDISALLKPKEKATVESVQPAVVAVEAIVPSLDISRPSQVYISPRARMRAEEAGIDYKKIAGSAADGMIIERDILNAIETRPKSTPLARRTAASLQMDLTHIKGSGPRGKIRREDVERAHHLGSAPAVPTIIPMRGMRKIIADRMKQSLNENAQATHRISVRMDEAFRLRTALEKTVGFNDLIVMAAAQALRDHPMMNAEIVEEGIWLRDFVNIGVAVAIENGLVVPVIKDADYKSLPLLASEIRKSSEGARSGSLSPEAYTGGCFTVSNLGMYGIEEFTAIINTPETGILAVGAIEDTPIAVNGQVEIHPIMKLTLSYDHRVIDGAPAAQFLAQIKTYLENPYKLL